MVIFTIITGVATLISLFLQVRGYFPQYQRFFSWVWIFLFGLTCGLLFNVLSAVSVTIQDVTLAQIAGVAIDCAAVLFILVAGMLAILHRMHRNEERL